MKIGLLGDGPVAEGIRSQVADTDATVTEVTTSEPSDRDAVVIVSDGEGQDIRAVNDRVCGTGTLLIAVEPGGFGGGSFDDVDIAATCLSGRGPCYECLERRVEAASNGDGESGDRRPRATLERLMGTIVGDTLAAQDADDVTALAGRMWAWPYEERQVLPVPGCPCCNAGTNPDDRWGPPRDPAVPADRSLEEALARAERAIDDRVGIVAEVGEVASYPAPYYLAQLASTEGFSDVQAPTHAAGVASDWNEAFMKALGEALERYSAGLYRSDSFVEGPESDVRDAVPVETFVRPDGWDDDPERSLPWLPATELPSEAARMLPAETCVFPPPTRHVRPAITTGLGLGSSGMAAVRAGLQEVIERDATMLAWYSTFEPLGLRIDDETFDRLVSRARGEGLAVSPLLLTQDVDVPVVAVAVHREDEWPRFAIGSDADLDPTAAARSALCEALQNWVELRDLGPDGAEQAGGWIGEYASFPANVASFVDVDGRVDADDLGADPPASPSAAVETLVEAVVQADMTPYVAWLTPRDVRALGFEAVRVVIPAAQPLFTDDPYFGERLETVPRALGFEPRPDRDPHPFP